MPAVIAPKQVSGVCRVAREVQAVVGGEGGGDHDGTLAKERRKRREGHPEHAQVRSRSAGVGGYEDICHRLFKETATKISLFILIC